MDEKEIKFSSMVKAYRKQMGLTMKELGQKMGKSESAVSRWESGENSPKMDDINALAKFFNVEMDTLVYGIEAPVKSDKAPVDLLELADDDDINWDEWLSFGGKPLSDRDKATLKALFGNRLKDDD